jgi:hypothetical protein
MQRIFEPMQKQVETWQRSELTDVTAKVIIYEARNSPSFAVALNCRMGSSSLNADVNALERLQIGLYVQPAIQSTHRIC